METSCKLDLPIIPLIGGYKVCGPFLVYLLNQTSICNNNIYNAGSKTERA